MPGGGESPQTRRVRGFVRALRKETALPVFAVDDAVDAAVLILRRFLVLRPGETGGRP